MKFSEWLDAEKGRTKAVAEHYGRTLSAISQWRIGVPQGRMLSLMEFTNNEVSLEEMLIERAEAAQRGSSSQEA